MNSRQRMAGERPEQVFSNDSAEYSPSSVAETRRYDDSLFREASRTGLRARYSPKSYDKEDRRVTTPELPDSFSMNERRDNTIAARKAKEEEARQRALWS